MGSKDAGASKLRMPQIRGCVAKGSGVEVKDVMVRFGWLRENGPGAALMVEVNLCRIKGSKWTVWGGLKDPVRVKSNLLWGAVVEVIELEEDAGKKPVVWTHSQSCLSGP